MNINAGGFTSVPVPRSRVARGAHYNHRLKPAIGNTEANRKFFPGRSAASGPVSYICGVLQLYVWRSFEDGSFAD